MGSGVSFSDFRLRQSPKCAAGECAPEISTGMDDGGVCGDYAGALVRGRCAEFSIEAEERV